MGPEWHQELHWTAGLVWSYRCSTKSSQYSKKLHLKVSWIHPQVPLEVAFFLSFFSLHFVAFLFCYAPLSTKSFWLLLSVGVQCLDLIESSHIMASQLCEDVDLHIMMHKAYGKGFIKTCKVSPDAYIQLALQLAYYRVSGGLRFPC